DIKSSPWKLKGREMRLEYFERDVQKVAD
ncbi:Crp/Fnr family transcriptional regulator, partial [Listeria monocytogenes]|nr:Crp/Fnr family transcriptional regulator [Listeria monocytogenes]